MVVQISAFGLFDIRHSINNRETVLFKKTLRSTLSIDHEAILCRVADRARPVCVSRLC
jgi:hypothetical protein